MINGPKSRVSTKVQRRFGGGGIAVGDDFLGDGMFVVDQADLVAISLLTEISRGYPAIKRRFRWELAGTRTTGDVAKQGRK